MDSGKIAWKQTRTVAIGVALGVAVMIGVFVLMGRYDTSVLLGGIVGGGLTVANFYAMAVAAMLAADRAERQDVDGGVQLLRGVSVMRLVMLAAVLFFCAYSGRFHVVSLVLPLLFVRPLIMLAEFFGRKGT